MATIYSAARLLMQRAEWLEDHRRVGMGPDPRYLRELGECAAEISAAVAELEPAALERVAEIRAERERYPHRRAVLDKAVAA